MDPDCDSPRVPLASMCPSDEGRLPQGRLGAGVAGEARTLRRSLQEQTAVSVDSLVGTLPRAQRSPSFVLPLACQISV